MPLHLSWQQIALRLLLACAASGVIGANRDRHGHPAGLRTTMLVCLAATLSMLQVNLLLPLAGKPAGSFNTLDLMRLPLGILSGIGFIGAGVIVKQGRAITGVTTAATLWFVTTLGLLFGAGNLLLGTTAAILALVILRVLKLIERRLRTQHRASLTLLFASSPSSSPAASEAHLRTQLGSHFRIRHWTAVYGPGATLQRLSCELSWVGAGPTLPDTPAPIEELRLTPGLRRLTWQI